MKVNHFVVIAAMTYAMVACSIDAPVQDTVSAITDDKQEITIEATLADNSNTTKTARKADGKIYWNPRDQINVFFGNDQGTFTSTNTEDAAKASFVGAITISGIVGLNEGEDDSTCLWGLYPYDENATFDGAYVHTTLSNHQIGVAGSFADDLYITLAKNNSFALSFYNVLAGIRFTVEHEGITSINFSGNNNEILTGDLALCFDSNERPIVQQVSNGSKTITLTPLGESFVVGEYYYILFVPAEFSDGFSMTFNTSNTEATLNYTQSVNFRRNTFGKLTNADKDLSFGYQPANEIWYTSTDSDVVPLLYDQIYNYYSANDDLDYIECELVSNTYYNGKGKMVFDKDIKYIGFRSFADWRFKNISFPEGTLELQGGSITNCKNLESVVLPSTLTKIGPDVFSGCTSLSAIEIPENVTSIGEGAFSGCTSLQRFNGKFASSDGQFLYSGTSLIAVAGNSSSFTIPSYIETIGEGAFRATAIETIYFSSGLKYINTSAFSGCKQLISLNLPNTVKYIGDHAFMGCSGLITVVLPSSLTSIGDEVFNDCNSLQSITFLSSTPPGCSGESCEPLYGVTCPVYVPAASLSTYQSNPDWRKYRSRMVGSTNIVFIDANVKSVCVSRWDSNSDGELSFDEAAAVTSLGTAFKNNTQIEEFSELQYFTGLTSIYTSAFNGCTALQSVILPSSITSIGNSAFEMCTALSSISFPDALSIIGSSAFFGCSKLTGITLRQLSSLGSLAFAACTSLGSVYIRGSITTIPASAFEGCTTLEYVSLPDNLQSIGAQAFYGCGCAKLTVPSNVTSIGDLAFGNCTNLKYLYVQPVYTPPTIGTSILMGSNSAVILVKYPSYYTQATGWSDYSSRIQAY